MPRRQASTGQAGHWREEPVTIQQQKPWKEHTRAAKRLICKRHVANKRKQVSPAFVFDLKEACVCCCTECLGPDSGQQSSSWHILAAPGGQSCVRADSIWRCACACVTVMMFDDDDDGWVVPLHVHHQEGTTASSAAAAGSSKTRMDARYTPHQPVASQAKVSSRGGGGRGK